MSDLCLEIHHLDVRGGDATAIIVKDLEQDGKELYRLLIDAGAEHSGSAALKAYLEAYLPGEFDCIIATHYHEDHIQGFSAANVKFKSFIDNGSNHQGTNSFHPRNGLGLGSTTNSFSAYKGRIQKPMPGARTAPRRIPIPFIESDFKLKDATPLEVELGTGTGIMLRCYCANGILANGEDVLGTQSRKKKKPSTINPNDLSLAFILEWGDFRYFTAGDLSGDPSLTSYYDIETKLLEYLKSPTGPLRDNKTITVFKASHHGSAHSNQPLLFTYLKPDTTVVSCNIMKEVPSPTFLKQLKENHLDRHPTARVVFTNTLKVDKNDPRYQPLQKIKDFIVKGNVVFGESGGNTSASNLKVKCAVIRRRVKDGQAVRMDPPDRQLKALFRNPVGYEIVLLERDIDDAQQVSETVKFTSYDIHTSWDVKDCPIDKIEAGFAVQAEAMISWLKHDNDTHQEVGKDYITLHYPGLLSVIERTTGAAQLKGLKRAMKKMFDGTFTGPIKKPYGQLYMPRPASENTLSNDEKLTLYSLLMNNSNQVFFNRAALPANLFAAAKGWNAQEPYASSGMKRQRQAENVPVRRSTRLRK